MDTRQDTAYTDADAEKGAADHNLRGLLDGVYAGILLLDDQGVIIEVNQKLLDALTLTRQQVLGESFVEDLSDAEPVQENLPQHLNRALSGEPQMFEWRARRAGDGSRCDFEVVLRRIQFNGQPVLLATLRNISERKNIQERQLYTQHIESMATVVGGIAHEFSNILNNVLGFATLIKKYIHDHAKALKYSQAIEQSVLRGDEVTQRLLAFARPDNRSPEPIPLGALLDELVLELRSVCPDTILVAQRYDGVLPDILGVKKELQQAVLNLCFNARDAILQKPQTAGRGTITLHAVRTKVTEALAAALLLPVGEECVTVSVSDDGVGIREEIADRIFDPFFTTKEPGRGTGLGLSIVYTIIRGHHGAINVESSYGEGSTFRVALPIHDPLRSTPARRGESQARNTELILLVDDELPMLEFGRDILVDHGYRVITAGDAAEALEIYRRQAGEIALVILDLIMPRMDGGQIYIEMKRINKSVKAMFCSGYTSDEVISSLLQEEHLRAVRKPFRISEFLTAVRETLDTPRS